MRQKQGSSWHSVLIESTYWIRNHMKHIQRQYSMAQTLLYMQAIARWSNQKFYLELTVWYQEELS
jgi:hypothetical protein